MDAIWGIVWPAVLPYALDRVVGQGNVADAGDHKGPPHVPPPPSPLRMLTGFL
jgi:hypothetical protein